MECRRASCQASVNDEGGLRLWEGAWVNEEGGLLLWEPTREYKEQGVGVRLWEATGSRLPPRMPGGGRGVGGGGRLEYHKLVLIE